MVLARASLADCVPAERHIRADDDRRAPRAAPETRDHKTSPADIQKECKKSVSHPPQYRSVTSDGERVGIAMTKSIRVRPRKLFQADGVGF